MAQISYFPKHHIPEKSLISSCYESNWQTNQYVLYFCLVNHPQWIGVQEAQDLILDSKYTVKNNKTDKNEKCGISTQL